MISIREKGINVRIHGTKGITRSKDVPNKSNYIDYEQFLKKDFHNQCGYCGKHERIASKGMEIDHFIPKKIDPSKINDYSNLVYSCFTCNRKKSSKWPTNDKNIFNNGVVGFVDPASEEFSKHLGRKQDGAIEYYTELGNYMYETVFKFNIRPTKEIWKASRLYILSEMLRKTDISSFSSEKKDQYIEIMNKLNDLEDYLFVLKE